MAFNLITASSLDVLAGRLAENLFCGLNGALSFPQIIIQSSGMERWLSLRLAADIGVIAGVEFYFLNGYFQDVIAAAYNKDKASDYQLLSVTQLQWLIFSELEKLGNTKLFKPVLEYINGDNVRRYQLAGKLAELYDKYALYRSDWLLAWEHDGAEFFTDASREEFSFGAGREGAWLAELWSVIKQQTSDYSIAELADECKKWLDEAAAFSATPVHIFGVSSMPPLYLDLLVTLSRQVEVYFYYLEVSHEYWGLVRSEKELLRRAGSNYEEGNSLLASFGGRNKDFLNLLISFAADRGFNEEESSITGCVSAMTDAEVPLLQRVQTGIRFMEQPVEKSVVSKQDNSIRFHSCFGRMRQVQALYQTLLDLFCADPTLKPKDVLVLTPSIKDFVPYIRAVFGGVSRDSAEYVPFTISDRTVAADNRVCSGLLAVLKLLSGRFRVSEVWDMYADPAYSKVAGIDPEDIVWVKDWLNTLQVHWGLDAAQRKEFSGVGITECTWREAEERLLLGYATDGDTTCFKLHDGREIVGVEVSGRLNALQSWLEFLARLFDFYRRYKRCRSAGEWIAFTRDLIAAFYNNSGSSQQVVLLALAELENTLMQSGIIDTELDFEVYELELTAALEQTNSGAGFIMGGVTFCQFQPMRNIPSRVICMLGLDEGTFPRVVKPLTFDISVSKRRLCDPSLKLDDQGVFLETLLSVTDKLLVFYSGRGVKKGEELIPAVPVVLLQNYLQRFYSDAAGGDGILAQLTVEHPLQSFSPRYFSGVQDELVSFSAVDCKVAVNISQVKNDSAEEYEPFEMVSLSEALTREQNLGFAELKAFYAHPCRWYLQNRCAVYLRSPEEELPADTDRLVMDGGYRRQQLLDYILRSRVTGSERDMICRSVAAKRVLPVGEYGVSAFGRLYQQTDKLAAAFSGITAGATGEKVGEIELSVLDYNGEPVGDVGVEYMLEPLDFYEGEVSNLRWHFSSKGSWRVYSELWLSHLLYSVILETAIAFKSRLYRTDGKEELVFDRFEPAVARSWLGRYLWGFYAGTVRPLPIFKGASLEYARQLHAARGNKTPEEALRAARMKYAGSSFGGDYPDSGDNYIRRCFGQDFSEMKNGAAEFMYCCEEFVLPLWANNIAGGGS